MAQADERIRGVVAALGTLFKESDKIECVPGHSDGTWPAVIRCTCTIPRGYWTGIPLICQREPRFVELNRLVVVNLTDKVHVRHGTCVVCNTLYFTVKDDYAKSKSIGERAASLVKATD